MSKPIDIGRLDAFIAVATEQRFEVIHANEDDIRL
jgi:hypothetical protein